MRYLVWLIDSLVNIMVIVVMIVLFVYGSYAIWDTYAVVQEASPTKYDRYKPTGNNQVSFADLRAENPDVFGWLTVYGTNIDYPLVQGEDNREYLAIDAQKKYTSSGAIFLDCKNNRSFRDFNSIIYGHHMAYNAMFGDISDFAEKDFFDTHLYGNIHYENGDHGIRFFAFMDVEAYSSHVYSPGLTKEKEQQEYLDRILAEAVHIRDVGVTIHDRIVLLSTCNQSVTNGRFLLVGVLTDKKYEDPFENETGKKQVLRIDDASSGELWNFVSLFMLLIISVLIMGIILGFGSKKQYFKQNTIKMEEKEK